MHKDVKFTLYMIISNNMIRNRGNFQQGPRLPTLDFEVHKIFLYQGRALLGHTVPELRKKLKVYVENNDQLFSKLTYLI